MTTPAIAGNPDILSEIVRAKEGEVERLRARERELRAGAAKASPPRGFAAALRRADTVTLLAEVKRRSPSAGWIREGADPVEVATAYAAGGAAALSVLTDEDYFGGSLEALRTIRGAVTLPVLRKDFVIDPLQVWEARAAGADAVLLIVRILEDARLRDLHAAASELGMDVLVEVHDEIELDRALAASCRLIGVNNRDLRTFTTSLRRSHDLAAHVPAEVTLVAESGIRTAEDVRELGASGVDAVLVGESLMRQDDLRAAAAELTGQPKGRRARAA